MNINTFPKVELHLHLDCSLSFAVVQRLAPSVSRREYERDFVAPARCSSLAEYLKRAPKGFLLMQDETSLDLVTEDLFGQLQADGVVYVEIRFAPLLHTRQGLSPEQVVETVDRAVEHMVAETGIQARLILCTLRHFDAAQSMATARLAEQFRGSRVTAIDLAGDEASYPLDAHREAFYYAAEQGIFRTAHAGEACGPESVWETLHLLNPTRIGHGTRSIEDPVLVQHLREQGIHLELCPSANVQIIPSIESWEVHPIDRLYRQSVRLNINTDTRMLTHTTLIQEYEGMQRVFGWGEKEFRETNLLAVEASFVDAQVKDRLRQVVAGEPGTSTFGQIRKK